MKIVQCCDQCPMTPPYTATVLLTAAISSAGRRRVRHARPRGPPPTRRPPALIARGAQRTCRPAFAETGGFPPLCEVRHLALHGRRPQRSLFLDPKPNCKNAAANVFSPFRRSSATPARSSKAPTNFRSTARAVRGSARNIPTSPNAWTTSPSSNPSTPNPTTTPRPCSR